MVGLFRSHHCCVCLFNWRRVNPQWRPSCCWYHWIIQNYIHPTSASSGPSILCLPFFLLQLFLFFSTMNIYIFLSAQRLFVDAVPAIECIGGRGVPRCIFILNWHLAASPICFPVFSCHGQCYLLLFFAQPPPPWARHAYIDDNNLNMQTCKHANIQTWKHANMQAYTCTLQHN